MHSTEHSKYCSVLDSGECFFLIIYKFFSSSFGNFGPALAGNFGATCLSVRQSQDYTVALTTLSLFLFFRWKLYSAVRKLCLADIVIPHWLQSHFVWLQIFFSNRNPMRGKLISDESILLFFFFCPQILNGKNWVIAPAPCWWISALSSILLKVFLQCFNIYFCMAFFNNETRFNVTRDIKWWLQYLSVQRHLVILLRAAVWCPSGFWK